MSSYLMQQTPEPSFQKNLIQYLVPQVTKLGHFNKIQVERDKASYPILLSKANLWNE